MYQNLSVLKDETRYLVMTEVTHEVLYSTASATDAIQQAMAQLHGGGVVTLGPGRFELDSGVTVPNGVWLRGSGRGTKIVANNLKSGDAVISMIATKGGEISDLTLTGQDSDSSGIIVDAGGDCKIHNVNVLRFKEYGIWVRNNSFLSTVRGCSLAENSIANLYFDGLERGDYGDFLPNLAADCMIYGGGKGIDCNRAIVLNLVGCIVYQTDGPAFHIRDTSNSVVITGCRTFQITGNAVVVENAHEFNLSSNILCWHTEAGVVVRNCNWGTISGNEVIDSGSYNSGAKDTTTSWVDLDEDIPMYNGIELINSQGYNVSGNTIFNWPVTPRMEHGIFEDASCFSNNIVSNNINYYEVADVVSNGKESLAVNNIGYPDKPFQSPEAMRTTLQSFIRGLTTDFVDELLALGED